MKNTYILIHRDRTTEEKRFAVTARGTEMISAHISRQEFGQHDNGNVIIFEPLIQLFESVRSEIGQPITINSGYRSAEYQKHLYKADPSGAVAKPGSSPHEQGAAMDLALPAGWTAQRLAALFQQFSVELGFPKARTGWRKYGGRFVHVDLIPMLFEPYALEKNPQPKAWRPGVTW